MKRVVTSLVVLSALAGCGTTGLYGVPTGMNGLYAQSKSRKPIKDGAYTLITQPDGSGAQAIFAAIDGAKRSVDLTMYLLQDTDVVTHLAAASARGVRVRVLLERDPFYSNPNVQHRPVPQAEGIAPLIDAVLSESYHSNQQAAADLQAQTQGNQVPAQIFWTDDSRFALTHEKGMVIDDAAAFIMSNNFTSNGLGANREYAIIDQVPAEVQEVENIFQADITDAVYQITQPNLVVSPDDGSGQGNAKTKLTALIASAQHTIQIQDEEFQDTPTAQLLGQKQRQGVKVEVMISTSAKKASDPFLSAAGIKPIYWSLPNRGELHAKLIIADGRAAYVGSVNLSTQSMGYNRELGIQLSDPTILKALSSDFASDWHAATGTNP